MLYEAIDEGDQETKKVKKLSLKPVAKKPDTTGEQKVKQYLAFSDSRQQASFAAVFFDSNHVRMLRKRLIWEMIKNKNYEEMKVNELCRQCGIDDVAETVIPNLPGLKKLLYPDE